MRDDFFQEEKLNKNTYEAVDKELTKCTLVTTQEEMFLVKWKLLDNAVFLNTEVSQQHKVTSCEYSCSVCWNNIYNMYITIKWPENQDVDAFHVSCLEKVRFV